MGISILRENVEVKQFPNATYEWSGRVNEDRELIFREAYEIKQTDFDTGIKNCTYQIGSRVFTDLSFTIGNTIKELSDGKELREYKDGTRFVFFYSSIPTFDSADRIWDSTNHMAVYKEEGEVVFIQCRHGYKIYKITIYIGLIKSIPVLDEYLKELS